MPSKDDDLSKPSFRLAAPKSGKRRGFVPRGTSVLDVPEGKERRVPDTVLRRPPVGPDTITGYSPSMAQRHAESLAGALTPRIGGPRAQAISQSLLGGPESALPFGIGLQELVPFSPYVADEAGQLIAQGVQEGSPLTTGMGLGIGALQAFPAIGPLARGAKGVVQRAAAAADPEAIRRYVAATQGITGLPGTAVVKPKGLGGNWLQGSVERMTQKLKSQRPTHRDEALALGMTSALADSPEVVAQMAQDAALNQWIDQKLNRYIKNEMATPEDPVRLLAEQRISHLPEDDLLAAEYMPEDLMKKRRDLGYPEQGLSFEKYQAAGFPPEGETGARMAGGWESITDRMVDTTKAGAFQGIPARKEALIEAEKNYAAVAGSIADQFEAHVNSIPGLSEAEKASTLKGAGFGYMANMLGRHDEFKAAERAVREARNFTPTQEKIFNENPWIAKVDPETPAYFFGGGTEFDNFGFDHIIDVLRNDLTTGRIRPDQLKNITMEQAVRRVHEYDQEAAKKAADTAAKVRADLPIQKEYPEGYKWVELNKPGAFAAESDMMGHSVRGYEPPKGHPDWTPESGDSGSRGYGHGGWEAIKSGRARVYSLVDPQGKSHVTVEIKQGKPWNERSGIFHDNPGLEDSWAAYSRETYQAAKERGVERDPNYIIGYPDWLKANDPDRFERYAHVFEPSPPEITQIKGKQNSAPDAKYRPFVQDFVRSGQWGRVRDFKNTGFDFEATGPRGIFDAEQIATLKKAGFDVPNYMTRDEAKRLQDELYKIETGKNPDTGEPMAAGGRVEAPEGAEDFIAQVRQRMQGQEQRMQAGGIVKKAVSAAGKSPAAGAPRVVYHAGADFQTPNPGLFTTPDRAAAEQFLRSSGGSRLHTFHAQPKRSGTDKDVVEAAKALGIYDPRVPVGQYLEQGENAIFDEAPLIVRRLREKGLDSVLINDGMSSVPSLVALDPAVLTRAPEAKPAGKAGGGLIKKALGTLSKEADTLKPTFKMPGADMPLAKIPESAPKVTEKTVEVKPGGAKAQKVTQSVIETPLSRRQVIKTAGSQVAQKVIPRISTDIPQLTPEEMFGGVADMPGLYAAMLPLVRRVAPHELDSMAKRLGFSLEDIIEHSAEDILPRGELVNEGVTRFMELFPETSSKVLKKAK